MDELQERAEPYQASELPNLLEPLCAPDSISNLFRSFILKPEVTAANVETYHYSGVAGDAIYTENQLTIFANIKHLLTTDHCMTTNTLDDFKPPVLGLRNRNALFFTPKKSVGRSGQGIFMGQTR